MTFINYTNDGKAVIQSAALILSGLEREKTLELHTLENAIVLDEACGESRRNDDADAPGQQPGRRYDDWLEGPGGG